MIGTLLFLSLITVLYRYTNTDKWWLWYVVIIGLLVKAGYELRMFGLIVSIVVWKVVSDIFRRR